ncbi:RNA polymerase sigma factor [Algibacillus agarilyticus]|uniref:RNA polymerase sigma factor n=1 Tax=Algibacillus agarilyticus TaxID=2234133 RepID=UPI000DCFED59|nr:RNA polymerase sigma factor [Algibacillus agarilyticus]
MIEENELALIEKAQQNDLEAFSQLIRLHEREVRICLAARLDSYHEAEDLAQETFIVAHRRISEFSPQKPIKYWFRAIAINLLSNQKRKKYPIAIGSSHDLENLLNDKIENHLTEHNESNVASALNNCIANLSDNLKKLVNQHYNEEYTVGELTELYGVKHSTLTMRLHRVRDKLRQCINAKLASSNT